VLSPFDKSCVTMTRSDQNRIEIAIDRLGLKKAAEALNSSGLDEFNAKSRGDRKPKNSEETSKSGSLSTVTLARWAGAKDKELRGRAELAARILETVTFDTTDKESKVLTYATVANPAAIPLVFLRSLVPELNRDKARIKPVTYLAQGEELRIGLRLTVKRVGGDDLKVGNRNLNTDDLVESLASADIDLIIVPESTFSHEAEPNEVKFNVKMVPLWRVLSAPTFVLQAEHCDLGEGASVYVYWEDGRDNSQRRAEELFKKIRLNPRAAKAKFDVKEAMPIRADELLERFKSLKEDNTLVYAFGQTTTLTRVYSHLKDIDDCAEMKLEEPTPWRLYTREGACDPKDIALLLRAMRLSTTSEYIESVFEWLKDSKDAAMLEMGLNRALLQTVEKYRRDFKFMCDDFPAKVVDDLAAAIFNADPVLKKRLAEAERD
jgi:hypothetical protein